MSDLPIPEDKKRDKEAMEHAVPYKQMQKRNILEGLPDYVKDPKNFMTIQRALLNTLSCGKGHSDPIQMANCKKCSENMLNRRKLMSELGFTSIEQYMAWRRTHEEVHKVTPLVDWDRGDKGVIKTK